jgi:hypothetical protein
MDNNHILRSLWRKICSYKGVRGRCVRPRGILNPWRQQTSAASC